MGEFNWYLLLVYIIPILFAVTVHEASHGFVANYYGDPTAKMLGRLTLSPHKHIDPLGTIIVPGLLLISGAPFLFGWAKPVPVTMRNLKNPQRDMAIIAIAGPFSNLIMGLLWAAVAKLGLTFSKTLLLMGIAGIQINLVLMLLNLLPLPPLDGSKVLAAFLRGPVKYFYDVIEPYGFFILLALLFTGILNKILLPLYMTSMIWITNLFNLNPSGISI